MISKLAPHLNMAELMKLLRFGLVGVFNTLAGYALFAFFAVVFRLTYNLSNFLSYVIMISVAFLIYKKVVFKSEKATDRRMVISYFVCAAIAFALNLAALNGLMLLGLNGFIAQIGAMVVYSVVFFLANRLIIFR